MSLEKKLLINYFPHLKDDDLFEVTSPQTRDYNCISWAMNVSNRWTWPPMSNAIIEDDEYWPDDIENTVSLVAFIRLFAKEGFIVCENDSYEDGYEKIALYSKGGYCTHAARQLPNGNWTSKLGPLNDIIHRNLKSLEGEFYGRVACCMKRKK